MRKALVLGTAQWGLKYGRANATGIPTEAVIRNLLLRIASTHPNVPITIDTARAYGTSESVIGSVLESAPALREQIHIVTKLSPLGELTKESAPDQVAQAVRASLEESRKALKMKLLPVVLLHRWAHRNEWGETAWNILREEQALGGINTLGASIQSVSELDQALADPAVQHIQLPCNLLDGRWSAAPSVYEKLLLRASTDVTIHVRSVFLQGLLLASADVWPDIPGVQPAKILSSIDSLVSKCNRKSRADLCIAYMKSFPWAHGLVLGMETESQLEENLPYVDAPPLTVEQQALCQKTLLTTQEELLNPALWPPPAR